MNVKKKKIATTSQPRLHQLPFISLTYSSSYKFNLELQELTLAEQIAKNKKTLSSVLSKRLQRYKIT